MLHVSIYHRLSSLPFRRYLPSVFSLFSFDPPHGALLSSSLSSEESIVMAAASTSPLSASAQLQPEPTMEEMTVKVEEPSTPRWRWVPTSKGVKQCYFPFSLSACVSKTSVNWYYAVVSRGGAIRAV